jgi:hypothetical protein
MGVCITWRKFTTLSPDILTTLLSPLSWVIDPFVVENEQVCWNAVDILTAMLWYDLIFAILYQWDKFIYKLPTDGYVLSAKFLGRSASFGQSAKWGSHKIQPCLISSKLSILLF